MTKGVNFNTGDDSCSEDTDYLDYDEQDSRYDEDEEI